MTTYVIYLSHPKAPTASQDGAGYTTPTTSGLSLDDSVTHSGGSKAILDEYVGSTSDIKVGKFLAEQQRADKYGRQWLASSDSGSTFIKPML